MERDNPLDDLDDEQMLALFELVDTPAPSPGFTSRTMRAVMHASLPAGRKALRDPLASMFGWAAVISSVAFAALAVALSQPIITAIFSRLITRGVGTGVWFIQFGQMALQLLDVLATTGLAVSRAVATIEGTTGLVLTAIVGAVSLSALHRLLISEGEDSQWPELS
jgi:xanthine/uracil permease